MALQKQPGKTVRYRKRSLSEPERNKTGEQAHGMPLYWATRDFLAWIGVCMLILHAGLGRIAEQCRFSIVVIRIHGKDERAVQFCQAAYQEDDPCDCLLFLYEKDIRS